LTIQQIVAFEINGKISITHYVINLCPLFKQLSGKLVSLRHKIFNQWNKMLVLFYFISF